MKQPVLSAGLAVVVLGAVLLMADCAGSQRSAVVMATPVPSSELATWPSSSPAPPSLRVSPTAEVMATPSLVPPPAEPLSTATALPTPTTATVPPTATATATPVAPQNPVPVPSPALVIDHSSVDEFERIPDEYIQEAAQLRLLLRGASVSANIDAGLNCLANNFPDRRPNYCDRRIPPEQVLFDPKYDRSNWIIEFHNPPPNPNPAWWDKVTRFVDRINMLPPEEVYDAVTFTFDYVDLTEHSYMDTAFFADEVGDNRSGVLDLESLEAAHPDKFVIWWTSNLARSIGTPQSQSFNQQMRAYAAANGKVLFDMADIESHAPDDAPCFDNKGGGIPAICPDYTDEREAGHLNALGQQRVSKALWVLMARLAGWQG